MSRKHLTPARYQQIFADNISRGVLDTPIGSLRNIASQDAVLCVEQTGRESPDAGERTDQIPADMQLKRLKKYVGTPAKYFEEI